MTKYKQKTEQPLEKATDTVMQATKAVIGTGILLGAMGAVGGALKV